MTRQTRASTRSDPSLRCGKILTEQFVGILPTEVLDQEVPGVHVTLVACLAAHLRNEVVLHRVVHKAYHVTCGSMVCFLLKSMRITKLALLQTQLLCLLIHLFHKCINVVIVSLIGVLERLRGHEVHVLGPI